MADEIKPKTKRTPKPKKLQPARVVVILPKNCKRQNLSIDALDSNTRDLAIRTTIIVDGDILFCRSIKPVTQGGEDCLQITVRPGSFKFVETA